MMPARAAVVLLLAAAAACGEAPRQPAPQRAAAPPPVVLPDLARADAAVQAQIRARYDEAQQAAREGAPAATLADTFGQLGMSLLAMEYLDAAASAFEHARTAAPADIRWAYYLAHVHRSGEPARAAALFDEVLDRERRPEALIWSGETHLAAGHRDVAEQRFLEVIATSPRSAAALGSLGRLELARGNHAAAVEYLQQALDVAPGASALHYPLSLAYRNLGNVEQADAHLQQRGDIDPPLADPLMDEVSAAVDSAMAFDLRARAALGRGDWAGATDLARRGLELAADNAAVRASLHHRLGTALSQTQGPAPAREHFLLALEAAPTLARAHFSLAILALRDGQTRVAMSGLRETLTLEPDYVEARVALGDVLRSLGRSNDALVEYERVLSSAPVLGAAHFGKAVALTRLGRERAAIAQLDAALTRDTSNMQLRIALARILACAGDASVRDGARALALTQPIMQSAPGLDAAEALAMALAETGRFTEAAALQREAVANARAAGRTELLPTLSASLRRYDQRQSCLEPWGYEPLYEGP